MEFCGGEGLDVEAVSVWGEGRGFGLREQCLEEEWEEFGRYDSRFDEMLTIRKIYEASRYQL